MLFKVISTSDHIECLQSGISLFEEREYFRRKDFLVRLGDVKAPVKSYLGKFAFLEVNIGYYSARYPRTTHLAYILYRIIQVFQAVLMCVPQKPREQADHLTEEQDTLALRHTDLSA